MQISKIKIALTFFTLLALAFLDSITADENPDSIQYYQDNEFSESTHTNNFVTRPYFEMAAGKELGVDQTYFTLGAYTIIPTSLCTNSSHLWLYNDTCWHHFLKGTNGASVEGGFIWGNDCRSFGGYVEYDYRRWHENSFQQISGGVLMKCCPWEVFLNLNYPLENKQTVCSTCFEYKGGYKASFIEYDATYRIVSLNVARWFCTCLPDVGVAVGIEPYYLFSGCEKLSHQDRDAWGGRARLLFNVCNALNVEASVSRDDIFDTRAQIILGIDLLQLFYNSGCDSSCCYLPNTFRHNRQVAIKNKESWKHNW